MQQVKWAEFELQELFEVKTSKKRFDANKVRIGDVGYPYVVRTATNNGIKGYLNEDEMYLNEGNTISFGQDTATMFYQEKAYFTGDKIKILKPRLTSFNKKNAQFFIPIMTRAFSSFSWGSSSFSEKIIKSQKLSLPIKLNANLDKLAQIDFDFMENFIAQLEAFRLSQLEAYLLVTGLKNYTLTAAEKQALADFENGKVVWAEYELQELFEKIKVKKLNYKTNDLPDKPEGDFNLPALTAGIQNQGLNNYVPRDNATILKNVISISANGANTGATFYQNKEFTVLQDAYAIKWIYTDDILTDNQYIFLTASISKAIYGNYEWTNKAGWEKIKGNKISLPIKPNANLDKLAQIDFDFMQTLISAVQKLVIKDVVLYADRKIAATRQVIEK